MYSQVVVSDAGASSASAVALTTPVIDRLRVKGASADNFDVMYALLELQAEAHHTSIKGGDAGLEALRKALFSPNPREQILQGIILETESGEPVGYMLISEMHSDEGDVLYLEDNFVREEFRGGGIGGYMFDMLRVIAAAKGHNAIACTVDESRQDTQRFYLNKCEMHRRPAPVLGMGEFHMANSVTSPGSVTIIHHDHVEQGLSAPGARGVQIDYAQIDADKVVRLTHAHIDQIATLPQEAFYIGEQLTPKEDLIFAMRGAVDHARNFALAVLGPDEKVECVTLGSETFSTFNCYKRANIGAPISTTGAPAEASAVLSTVAFCQQMPGYSRIELQLDHVQAQASGLGGMFNACGSQMTEQAGSDELKFSVHLEDITRAVRTLSPQVMDDLVAVPRLMGQERPVRQVSANTLTANAVPA